MVCPSDPDPTGLIPNESDDSVFFYSYGVNVFVSGNYSSARYDGIWTNVATFGHPKFKYTEDVLGKSYPHRSL